MVRKGLWSPALENGKGVIVEELSSKILHSLKRGQGELEEQCSRMMEIQQNSMEAVQELSILSDETDDTDPLDHVQHCTQAALALQEKLQGQNIKLRHLHQILKITSGKDKLFVYTFLFTLKAQILFLANETGAASVVTQTSFDMHAPDLSNSSVWKNMNLQDRIWYSI
jgi:hypothetical protein